MIFDAENQASGPAESQITETVPAPSFDSSCWDKKLNISEAFPVLKSQEKEIFDSY